MWDTDAIFAQLRPCLEQAGFTVHSLDLVPSDGTLPLQVLAKQLDLFVAQKIPAPTPFHLIGFSMGGIVGRYYLQRLDGLARVRNFVTIASPHRGSILGWLGRTPGAKQLAPGSHFLTDLNRDIDRLKAISCTSIWTPFDLMILPTWSSIISPAQTYLVPTLLHKWMVYDRRVFNKILAALQN